MNKLLPTFEEIKNKDEKLVVNIDDVLNKVTPVSFENEEDLVEIELDILPEVESILNQVAEEKKCTVEELINGILLYFVNHEDETFQLIKENRTDRCKKGELGKPLFDYEDEVGFYIKPYEAEKEIFCIGKIGVVDRYGTFEQNEEPSYDIMVENFNNSGEPMFVKHVRESECYDINNLRK